MSSVPWLPGTSLRYEAAIDDNNSSRSTRILFYGWISLIRFFVPPGLSRPGNVQSVRLTDLATFLLSAKTAGPRLFAHFFVPGNSTTIHWKRWRTPPSINIIHFRLYSMQPLVVHRTTHINKALTVPSNNGRPHRHAPPNPILCSSVTGGWPTGGPLFHQRQMLLSCHTGSVCSHFTSSLAEHISGKKLKSCEGETKRKNTFRNCIISTDSWSTGTSQVGVWRWCNQPVCKRR